MTSRATSLAQTQLSWNGTRTGMYGMVWNGTKTGMYGMVRNGTRTAGSSPLTSFQWVNASLYIFILLYAVMIIVIILSNITVIISYNCMDKKLKEKIPNILLLNQSLVDLFIGLSAIPRVVCALCVCQEIGYKVSFFFVEYSTFLALGVLLVGTLERFMSVKFPFVHREKVTINHIAGILVLTWILTLLPALVNSSNIALAGNKELSESYHIAAYCILMFTTILVFIFLGLTYQRIRSAIAKRPCNGTLDDNPRTDHSSQKKVNRVFRLMSLLYTITIVPHVVGTIVIASANLPGTLRETRNIVKTSLHLFYISSSLINPIITVLGKPDYKETLLFLFQKVKSKKIKRSKSKEEYPLKNITQGFGSSTRSLLTKYQVI